MNKHGVTIIELLIYIILFAIVSLLIGKQFKGLIENYSANKNVVRQQTEARDVLGQMIQELRNTGLKVFVRKSGTAYSRRIAAKTFVGTGNPIDSSSIKHTQGDPYDQLQVYKLQLNKDGDSLRTDSTRYYVSGTTLKRDYKPSSGTSTSSVIAENVYALQFEYGVLASNDSFINNENPLRTPLATYWDHSGTATVSMNASTISLTCAAGNSGYLKYKTGLTVTANRKYKVILTMSSSGGFPKNLDSMKISFQNFGKTVVYGSEKFKPWEGQLELTLGAHTSSAANGAYVFIEYAAAGSGLVLFSGIDIRVSQRAEYLWLTNLTNPATESRFVKAIRINMLTRSSGKTTAKTTGSLTVGEVTVNRTGDYIWRLYSETVEVPNNGVF